VLFLYTTKRKKTFRPLPLYVVSSILPLLFLSFLLQVLNLSIIPSTNRIDVGQTLSGCCCIRVLCCGLPAALAAIVEKGGVSGILGRGCNGAHAFSFYIFQEKISRKKGEQRKESLPEASPPVSPLG